MVRLRYVGNLNLRLTSWKSIKVLDKSLRVSDHLVNQNCKYRRKRLSAYPKAVGYSIDSYPLKLWENGFRRSLV